MPRTSSAVKIRVAVAAGFSLSAAVKGVLEECGGLAAFAERHRVTRSEVSACLNGQQRCTRVRRALALELEIDGAWLDAELDALIATRRGPVECLSTAS